MVVLSSFAALYAQSPGQGFSFPIWRAGQTPEDSSQRRLGHDLGKGFGATRGKSGVTVFVEVTPGKSDKDVWNKLVQCAMVRM